jgi:signal transduction histidine kinase
MASALGVIHARRDELDKVMSGRAENVAAVVYSVDDGLLSPEVSAGVYPGAWQRTDGTIWFATARGISVLDPRVAAPVLQARPLIEDVRIDATTVPHAQPIVMRATQDRLEFFYTVPTFTAPRRLRFRYRLEGYDTGWVNAADRRVAEYTNLPPRSYRFFVEASDDGRRWLASPTAVEVRRLPAMYQTGWFAALCLVAIAGLILLVHHRRMRVLRLRHQAIDNERRRMAMEFHDTLAQGLTGAMLQIEGAFGQIDHRVRLAEHLQTGKDLIRSTLAEARRVLLDLRSESLDAQDLAAAFVSMMNTMTKGLPIQGSVQVVGHPRRLRDARVENHILRIGQEAITNSLRHSNAKNVLLTIEFQPRKVIVAVRDDGRGSGRFTLDELSASSHGIRGMRERAAQIHAKLTTRTIAGRGFEVVVEVSE